MAKDPLATVQEVADYFNVPVKTIYEWSSRKIGPESIKVGRHLRFRWSAVEAWLEAAATRRK